MSASPPPASTLLSAHDLSVMFGERVILSGVNLSVAAGERVALLGRNGAGKTTLLRVLTGELGPDDGLDEGEVWRAAGLRVAVLAQHHHHPANLTVRQLMDAAHPYREAEARLLALENDLGNPDTLNAWTDLHAQLEAAEAYAWPSRVRKMLGQLDLTRFLEREAASLSGGERTRLALALALAQEPDVLLLDEPTNHLDIRMREWLEGWLRNFRGGVVLTSHDRDFLDAVATRSLWLAHGEAQEYAGGYTRARQQRELERRTQTRAHRQAEQEAGRLGGSVEWLDRRGRPAQAVKTRAERVQIPEAPLPERQLRMRLLAGTARARVLAWGEHLSKSYGPRLILSDAAFKLRQGDRVALLGANGTGKTTLLQLLTGETFADDFSDERTTPAPPKPVLKFASGVTVAYLDQQWHGLNPAETLHGQFEGRFGKQAGAILGRAGFTAADWPKLPETLSGGERARAGLALVSALRSDVLLLDEPTNHLDVEALEALEHAIHAYGGAVIIVTHDRRFAREVANRLWVIEGAVLHEVSGWHSEGWQSGGWGQRDYTDPARTLQGDPPPPPPEPTPRQKLAAAERELARIQAELDRPPGTLSGREEGRLRAAAQHISAGLHDLYAEAFAAPQWDAEVREPPLRVRAQKFDEAGQQRGGMFWAARDESCPHLAWDGETLRFVGTPPAWYGAALLGGALRILFEQWNVGRVRLGEPGEVLTRRKYFERLGVVRRQRNT